MASNRDKMLKRWQDAQYREKMLEALARGRETYTSDPRLLAETAYRSSRTRAEKVQRGGTQYHSGTHPP